MLSVTVLLFTAAGSASRITQESRSSRSAPRFQLQPVRDSGQSRHDAGDSPDQRRHDARLSHRGKHQSDTQAGSRCCVRHIPAHPGRYEFECLGAEPVTVHARRHHRQSNAYLVQPTGTTPRSCFSALSSAQTPGGAPGEPLPVSPREFEEFESAWTTSWKRDVRLGLARPLTARAAAHVTASGAVENRTFRSARRQARSARRVRRADPRETFHLFYVPSHSYQPQIPADATVFARRVPIPLFGAGLVEAIPDESLLALEDPVDRNRDGVSGRAAMVVDVATGERRVGRFGWKAQHATLLTFGADAYRNEMGITNELFSQELAVGVTGDRMQLCDRIPDIEDKRDPRSGRGGRLFWRASGRGRRRRRVPRARGASSSASHERTHGRKPTRRCKLTERESLFHIGSAAFQICCCTTSAPATVSHKVWLRQRDSHTSTLGHSSTAVRTTGLRPPSRKRLGVTRTRRNWRGDLSARPKAIAAHPRVPQVSLKWTVSRSR